MYKFILIPVLLIAGFLWPPLSQQAKPLLKVSDNKRYLAFEDGKPFFWMGGTAWGMPEWLTREEVDLYLENRKEKGFNVIQICAFWGKRKEDPVRFTTNPPNAYGFKAFKEKDGKPDTGSPWVVEGGTPQSPNDHWDHVEYIIQAAAGKKMFIALLPVWGRRYVNGTHPGFSEKLFSISQMSSYGEFLGARYKGYDNIIWVLGGDVAPDTGGDFLPHYRAMAEGIVKGITGKPVKWNEASPLWDDALMTYHPDGTPLKNSSAWFHNDPWLDFNMIETWGNRDQIYTAVRQDYELKNPVKPVVMGEPAYEGVKEQNGNVTGIDMRRQAYQSFFAGAAGFTYGVYRDENGNGPLFSPYKGWEELLNMEGAESMKWMKLFCLTHNWPYWEPANELFLSGRGRGELEKTAMISRPGDRWFIYFPDRSLATLNLIKYRKSLETVSARWYRPSTGEYSMSNQYRIAKRGINLVPPYHWTDAVLILNIQ